MTKIDKRNEQRENLGFVEWHLARNKNVNDDTESPNVRFQWVVSATLQDLGRGVRFRATKRLAHVSICRLNTCYSVSKAVAIFFCGGCFSPIPFVSFLPSFSSSLFLSPLFLPPQSGPSNRAKGFGKRSGVTGKGRTARVTPSKEVKGATPE